MKGGKYYRSAKKGKGERKKNKGWKERSEVSD